MKKIIAGASIALAALGVAGFASAANTVTNVDDQSAVIIKSKSKFDANATVSQNASITNIATSAANSGNNKVFSADDQTGTTVTTGAAQSAVLTENTANKSTVNITATNNCGCDNTVNNVTDESLVKVKAKDKVFSDAVVAQSTTAASAVGSVSDTGNNKIKSGDSLTTTVLGTGISASGSVITNWFNKSTVNLTRSATP